MKKTMKEQKQQAAQIMERFTPNGSNGNDVWMNNFYIGPNGNPLEHPVQEREALRRDLLRPVIQPEGKGGKHMNSKKQATQKTLYEIAWVGEDGNLNRGGLKATIATVGKWIEEALALDPNTIYVAVPADKDAITLAEHRERMKEGVA